MTLKMEIKEEPMAFEDSIVEMMETTEVSPGHLKHSPSSSVITSSFSASQDTTSGIMSTPSFIHGNRTPETTESSSTTFHLSSSSDVMIPTSADFSVSSPSAVVSPASSDQTLTSPGHDEIRQNHKERDRSKTNFSIDEILKPSFGHKKLTNSVEEQESAFQQPLDMRLTSTPVEGSDGKHRTEQDKVLRDNLCHQYDDYSNHSYTSSNSSPDLHGSDHGNCNSGNRFGIDYNKIFGNHNQTLGSINAFANPNEFWNSLNKLHFSSIMSPPHNFSNHLTFGFDVNALRNQIFSDIKLSNYYFQQPQNVYSSFFNEQIHHLNNTDFNKHSKFENSFLRHNYEPKPIKLVNVKTSNNFSTTCKTKEVHMNPSKPSYSGEAKTLADVKPSVDSISTKEFTTKRNISSLPQHNSSANCSRNKSNNNVKGVDRGESSVVKDKKKEDKLAWPAWVYCTRYSDRPSSGPRYRKPRKKPKTDCDDKRPRTAFSSKQLQRLKYEFEASPYLSEARRKCLALELGLNESQVKIWFQNKRAKLKKCSGAKNLLAMKLMEEGLYNHSTIVVDDNDDNGNNEKDNE